MEEKDRKYFLVLMAMLSEAFKEEVSSERGKLYFEFLQKYSLSQVTNATKRSVEDLKWFPKISELIEIINPSPYRDFTYEGDEKGLELEAKRKQEHALEFIKKMTKLIGQKEPKSKERLPYFMESFEYDKT